MGIGYPYPYREKITSNVAYRQIRWSLKGSRRPLVEGGNTSTKGSSVGQNLTPTPARNPSQPCSCVTPPTSSNSSSLGASSLR